ncbi:MAG: hypothetical protein GDA44_08895 [Prochloron sp. SP5CPC1]|nr:hypothetical protein [Candidatus Paraprochloron terpiosi SP5CPC1]
MPIDNFFRAGGVVAWPLLAFSLAAIALIFERLVFWSRVNLRQKRLIREVLRSFYTQPDRAMQRLRNNADLPQEELERRRAEELERQRQAEEQ